MALTVDGGLAYVAQNTSEAWWAGEGWLHSSPGGIETLDLRQPTAPRVLGTSFGASALTPAAVGIGERLFMVEAPEPSDVAGRLWLFEAANPAHRRHWA